MPLDKLGVWVYTAFTVRPEKSRYQFGITKQSFTDFCNAKLIQRVYC